MSKTAMNTYQRDQKRIAELEAENKMLMRSLAAQPDKQTSTGAAQAVMEYQIELRDKRIAELKAELKDAFYDGRDARERAEKAEAQLVAEQTQSMRLLNQAGRYSAQLDAVREVRRLLATQCTNSHAVELLDAALNGEGK